MTADKIFVGRKAELEQLKKVLEDPRETSEKKIEKTHFNSYTVLVKKDMVIV